MKCPFCRIDLTFDMLGNLYSIEYCKNFFCDKNYTIQKNVFEEYEYTNGNNENFFVTIDCAKKTFIIHWNNKDVTSNYSYYTYNDVFVQNKSIYEINNVIKRIEKIVTMKAFW